MSFAFWKFEWIWIFNFQIINLNNLDIIILLFFIPIVLIRFGSGDGASKAAIKLLQLKAETCEQIVGRLTQQRTAVDTCALDCGGCQIQITANEYDKRIVHDLWGTCDACHSFTDSWTKSKKQKKKRTAKRQKKLSSLTRSHRPAAQQWKLESEKVNNTFKSHYTHLNASQQQKRLYKYDGA